MAKTSVGNLSAVLALESDKWNQGLADAAERVETFGKKAKKAANAAGEDTRRNSQIFMEASRGFEDFLVSFQTGGLSGGLRGAANNIGQIGSMLGPMAGAWATIGATIGAVVLPRLWEYISGMFDATDATAKLEAANTRFNESLQHQVGLQKQLREVGRLEDTAQVAAQIQSVVDEITDKSAELAGHVVRREKLEAERAKAVAAATPSPVTFEEVAGVLTAPASSAMGYAMGQRSPVRESEAAAAKRVQEIDAELGLMATAKLDTIKLELSGLETQREALEKRWSELNQIESDRFAAQMTGGMNVGPSFDEAMAVADERERERQSKIADTQLELELTRKQKRQEEAERVPREDRELQQQQLQRFDRMIRILEDQLLELKSNQLIGVGGE